MVTGIGLDLVEVERIRAFHERHGGRGIRRLFTAGEVDYCTGLADPAPSLAARFAAKEAFFKAVGTGFGAGGGWLEVEVERDGRGAPSLVIHGRALRTLEQAGARVSHLSLTHTARTAAAVVVLERD